FSPDAKLKPPGRRPVSGAATVALAKRSVICDGFNRRSMELPPDFERQLQERTVAELFDVLSHPDDYLPGAVEAATKELHRRKLAPEATTLLQAAEALP